MNLDYIHYPTKSNSVSAKVDFAAMELCTRTFTTTSLPFNPSFSLPSSSSSSSISLHLHSNTTLKPFKFNLSSSFIQPSLYHHTSSPFTVSASSSSSSSSVELFPENDRLPAQLKVTETKESNSRVCLTFFLFFFFTLFQFYFMLHCFNLIFGFYKNM